MRNLVLELEALEVDSFATDPLPQDGVNGNYYFPALAGTGMSFCLPDCVSCAPECDTYNPTV